jgi:hypothetical protein
LSLLIPEQHPVCNVDSIKNATFNGVKPWPVAIEGLVNQYQVSKSLIFQNIFYFKKLIPKGAKC